mmetsp:Transcript_33324/g.99201  ORF Transcript_33324/g.99201 Transcript_33324/m.99201 type:complete len:238 (-) Transcript_33324:477-1190(-)
MDPPRGDEGAQTSEGLLPLGPSEEQVRSVPHLQRHRRVSRVVVVVVVVVGVIGENLAEGANDRADNDDYARVEFFHERISPLPPLGAPETPEARRLLPDDAAVPGEPFRYSPQLGGQREGLVVFVHHASLFVVVIFVGRRDDDLSNDSIGVGHGVVEILLQPVRPHGEIEARLAAFELQGVHHLQTPHYALRRYLLAGGPILLLHAAAAGGGGWTPSLCFRRRRRRYGHGLDLGVRL